MTVSKVSLLIDFRHLILKNDYINLYIFFNINFAAEGGENFQKYIEYSIYFHDFEVLRRRRRRKREKIYNIVYIFGLKKSRAEGARIFLENI